MIKPAKDHKWVFAVNEPKSPASVGDTNFPIVSAVVVVMVEIGPQIITHTITGRVPAAQAISETYVRSHLARRASNIAAELGIIIDRSR